MDGKFATAFKFSRDGLTAAKPRNVSALSGEKIAFLSSMNPTHAANTVE